MAQFLNRWWAAALAVIVVAAGLTYAFWPRPVPVSLGTAERGSMMVTVEDEGETRVKEVYTISAPLAAASSCIRWAVRPSSCSTEQVSISGSGSRVISR